MDRDGEDQKAEDTVRAPRENRFIWRDGDFDLFDEDEVDIKDAPEAEADTQEGRRRRGSAIPSQ